MACEMIQPKRHNSSTGDADRADLRGFYHAFGAIRIRLATMQQATKKSFSVQPVLCLAAFVAKKLCRRQRAARNNNDNC